MSPKKTPLRVLKARFSVKSLKQHIILVFYGTKNNGGGVYRL
mgnify:CR=1 FL=1